MNETRNRPISGGKAVVECLKAYNIKYVFGLIGSATMELFDALYDEKSINFVDRFLRRRLLLLVNLGLELMH